MHALSFTRSAVELLQRILAPSDRQDGAFAALQWDYSCAADLLTAWIGQPQSCDEIAVDDSIVIRISRETGQPVGIDVHSAFKRSGRWPGALDGAYARALLEQHGPAALATWRARRGSVAQRTTAKDV